MSSLLVPALQLCFLLLFLPPSSSFVSRVPRFPERSTASSLGRSVRPPSATRDEAVPTTLADTLTSEEEAHLKDFITNLFAVCAHIQNPDLYTPTWADKAMLVQTDDETAGSTSRLVTSSAVQRGEIVTLFPLDALGLTFPNSNKKQQGNRKARRKAKSGATASGSSTTKKDFVVFDQDRDGEYFQGKLAQSLKEAAPLKNDYKIRMSLSIAVNGKPRECKIFVDVNPTHPPLLGWMGHLATRPGDQQASSAKAANCVVFQLLGPCPLCALAATTDMEEGTELIVATMEEPFSNLQFAKLVGSNYRVEFSELGSYLEMAYQPPIEPRLPERARLQQQQQKGGSGDAQSSSSLFHAVRSDYPGLYYLHRDPDVMAIDNFLTDEQCEEITRHAASHLYPCVIKHPETGKVYQDPTRTSTNANMPQSDVPKIVEKLVDLLQCPDASYLETLQVLKYTKGQTFVPHTDGFDGPTTAGGFRDSGRLVTIFCYLNDVPEGGETRFNQLRDENNKPLSVKPRKGMAVLHFPTTTGLQEDPRTEHEGCPAVGDHEKWLLVTWMWQHPRTDPLYAESNFPSIMGKGR